MSQKRSNSRGEKRERGRPYIGIKRLMISLPVATLEALDQAAAAAGKPRSTYLADLLAKHLKPTANNRTGEK